METKNKERARWINNYRCLFLHSWFTTYPNAQVSHLEVKCLFKFDSRQCLKDDFENIVSSCWGSNPVDHGMSSFTSKLKMFRHTIVDWNWHNHQNSKSRINNLLDCIRYLKQSQLGRLAIFEHSIRSQPLSFAMKNFFGLKKHKLIGYSKAIPTLLTFMPK